MNPRLLDSVFPAGSVVRETLPNGLRVVVRPKSGCGVVAIVTYVGAGYFDETDDVSGIAHVLEHMYFKGTPTRGVGEIARATKASGGLLNAATIYDHTHYYTVLPANGFEAGMEIQADAYANLLIDRGELGRELEVIIEEAKRKSDTPTAVATETLFALLHDTHRMRRWRIGQEPGLRALTRDKVLGFYQNFYRPRNTVLSIVGDVKAGHAIAEAMRRYGAVPDQPVVRTPGPTEASARAPGLRYQELDGDVQQSEVLLGWRTPELTHADTPVLNLASVVLSGDARPGSFAPCATGVSRRQSVRGTTHQPSLASLWCTPRRDPSGPPVRCARHGIRSSGCVRAIWARQKSNVPAAWCPRSGSAGSRRWTARPIIWPPGS